MGAGGVPPRLLIIDDGWQSTDLDAPLRPPTSEAVVTEHEVGPKAHAQNPFLSVHPFREAPFRGRRDWWHHPAFIPRLSLPACFLCMVCQADILKRI
jgi:hypothetical protein